MFDPTHPTLSKPAIIVAGMGRCGTSLTMQMLHRAGVPCVGTFPAFESEHSSFKTFDPSFLADLAGKAMKIIDPKRMAIPKLDNHVVIWLDRDPRQQAASIAKMVAPVSGPVDRNGRRRIAGSLRSDRLPNMLAFEAVPMLVIRFENLINATFINCSSIASFLAGFGWEVDPFAMAEAVLERGSDCLPFMLEERLLWQAAS